MYKNQNLDLTRGKRSVILNNALEVEGNLMAGKKQKLKKFQKSC